MNRKFQVPGPLKNTSLPTVASHSLHILGWWDHDQCSARRDRGEAGAKGRSRYGCIGDDVELANSKLSIFIIINWPSLRSCCASRTLTYRLAHPRLLFVTD